MLGLASAPLPAQEAQELTAELKRLSLEELARVDVTSVSRRAEPLFGAPAAVTVVTGEEVRRSGATTLPDALRLATGMQVGRFDSRTYAVSARGFNISTANKLQVLIDGRSVYSPLFAGVLWDVPDVLLEDLDRIEVIRGPGATLWGANAVNGVVNVITKSARDTQGSLLSAGGGSEEQAFAAARHGGRAGERLFYRLYGKYAYRDALALAQGGSADDPLRRAQGGFHLRWERGAEDVAIFQGDLYRGLIGHPVQLDTEISGGNLLGRWERTLAGGSQVRVGLYWDRSHRDSPRVFEERRDTADLDLQHRVALGRRHDVVWGAGYRTSRDRVEDSPVLGWDPNRRTISVLNLFAQDEVTLLPDRLRLTVGAKLEEHESTGLEAQPNVRLAWTPDDRRTVWASVARAVRSPSRLDEDLRIFSGPVLVLRGSRDFEAEELLAYEAGWRQLLGERAKLDAAVFHHEYDELRSQEPTPGSGLPIVLANRLEGRVRGVELEVDFDLTPTWRWRAGAAWLDKELRLEPGSGDSTRGRSEGHDPDVHGFVRTGLDLPGGVELDGTLRYVDDLPTLAVPSYLELDLRLGWRPRAGLELELVGRNLLDGSHLEFAPAGGLREEVERGAYARATLRF